MRGGLKYLSLLITMLILFAIGIYLFFQPTGPHGYIRLIALFPMGIGAILLLIYLIKIFSKSNID